MKVLQFPDIFTCSRYLLPCLQGPASTATVRFALDAIQKGRDGRTIAVGAEVEFSMIKEAVGGAKRAVRIVVVKEPPARKQLGQVIMLKSNFGFIKCCERAEDLFFHFTAIEVRQIQHTSYSSICIPIFTLSGRISSVLHHLPCKAALIGNLLPTGSILGLSLAVFP